LRKCWTPTQAGKPSCARAFGEWTVPGYAAMNLSTDGSLRSSCAAATAAIRTRKPIGISQRRLNQRVRPTRTRGAMPCAWGTDPAHVVGSMTSLPALNWDRKLRTTSGEAGDNEAFVRSAFGGTQILYEPLSGFAAMTRLSLPLIWPSSNMHPSRPLEVALDRRLSAGRQFVLATRPDRARSRLEHVMLSRREPAAAPGPHSETRQSLAEVRPKNRVLAALPAEEFRRLAPYLMTVPVRAGQVLHTGGEDIRFVYFPNGGVVSMETVLLDGTLHTAATVGDEGVIGGEAMLSTDAISSGDTQVRVPDTNAERMSVEVFRRAITEPGVFRDLVGRHLQTLVVQLMQNAACRARHDAQQRCAHWLLSTHDRMHRRDFLLSHEGLADMLGMQRPTVSAVAAVLQRRGLIRYTHGHIAVLDRRGLESRACECYAQIRAQLRRLDRP